MTCFVVSHFFVPSCPSSRAVTTLYFFCRDTAPVTGGDVMGIVYENEIIDSHKILVPPNVYGTVTKVSRCAS